MSSEVVNDLAAGRIQNFNRKVPWANNGKLTGWKDSYAIDTPRYVKSSDGGARDRVYHIDGVHCTARELFAAQNSERVNGIVKSCQNAGSVLRR